MSLPTNELSRLSLRGMPTTRSQAARALGEYDSAGSSFDEDEAVSDSEQDDDSSESTPAPPSGIDYDYSNLTPRTKFRFDETWKHDFKITGCTVFHESKDNEYVAVQVVDKTPTPKQYAVRFGAPGSNYEQWRCKCWSPRPCHHLIHIMDQVSQVAIPPSMRVHPHYLTKEGWPENQPPPFQQFKSVGIERLALDIGWGEIARRDPGVSEPSSPVSDTEMTKIREILSTFSEDSADDFRPDLTAESMPTDLHQDTILVPGDLTATVARLMAFDDDTLKRFELVVSKNDKYIQESTKGTVRRLNAEAKEAVNRMDAYTPDDVEVFDVGRCAKELSRIVGDIGKLKDDPAPLGAAVKEEIVESLIYILGTVIDHHEDMYKAPIWNKTTQQSNPLADHSLYHCLIGDSRPSGADSFLKILLGQVRDHADIARSFIDVLQSQFSAITQPGLGASQFAISQFKDTIKELRSARMPASVSSASGAKRLGAGDDGGRSKRLR